MATNSQRLRTALEETLQLQSPESDEYKQWLHGPRSSPIPPSVPAGGGSFYPTTDRALACITEIIDSLRDNDVVLARTLSRDEMFKRATGTFGAMLSSLIREADDNDRWKQYRGALTSAFAGLPTSQTVYIPTWLFIRQEYGAFSVGPVEFMDRSGWLDKVESLRGCRPAWRSGVEEKWGLNSSADSSVEGDDGAQIKFAMSTVTRFATVEQQIACVAVAGFDDREAGRRALLATRIAIDAIRLLIPGHNKKRVSTSSDHGPPLGIERLRQTAGHDLVAGSEADLPGVGGTPGLAQEVIDTSAEFRLAAGNCIKIILSPTPAQESLPELSQRWGNAIHWYGRACVSDVDFVALPMFGFVLDILCGGKEEAGIRDLACALFEKRPEDIVGANGMTLKAAVRKVYEWRSKIAHGSMLAIDLSFESERVFAESIANPMLFQYAMNLEQYRSSASPLDTGDKFLKWIQQNRPSTP
ncbi:MAG: hypothetical protein JWM78_162 [Verrucomicrobiaceae bacterium]|nr:hypothetical protein [Verrucomicrobiaceae bacterium]